MQNSLIHESLEILEDTVRLTFLESRLNTMLVSCQLLLLLSSPLYALEVTSTSPCTSVCEGPSITYGSNLTCIDNDYSATSSGSVFKACLQCEASSTAVDEQKAAPQNNDVYWFLCGCPSPFSSSTAQLTTILSQHEIHPARLSLPTQHLHPESSLLRIRLCTSIPRARHIVVL